MHIYLFSVRIFMPRLIGFLFVRTHTHLWQLLKWQTTKRPNIYYSQLHWNQTKNKNFKYISLKTICARCNNYLWWCSRAYSSKRNTLLPLEFMESDLSRIISGLDAAYSFISLVGWFEMSTRSPHWQCIPFRSFFFFSALLYLCNLWQFWHLFRGKVSKWNCLNWFLTQYVINMYIQH